MHLEIPKQSFLHPELAFRKTSVVSSSSLKSWISFVCDAVRISSQAKTGVCFKGLKSSGAT